MSSSIRRCDWKSLSPIIKQKNNLFFLSVLTVASDCFLITWYYDSRFLHILWISYLFTLAIYVVCIALIISEGYCVMYRIYLKNLFRYTFVPKYNLKNKWKSSHIFIIYMYISNYTFRSTMTYYVYLIFLFFYLALIRFLMWLALIILTASST